MDPAPPDPPGWYCYAGVPRLADWDGTAWTGASHPAVAAPALPGPPPPFAFARQPWLRWMLVGQALVILPTILSGSSGQALWSWVSVIGFVAFLGGAVQVVTRYCSLDLLPDPAGMTWIGIGSGVVAFGFGLGLEVLSTHLAGWPTTLWLAGPIEEGGKLLVPVLLLAFGPPRFRTPRVGLYLVLVSGATVGVLEGTEYVGRPEFAWAHLEMALVRPSAELLHVFVTGFAAAVIWLAAWRRGRPVTVAGVVAFAVAAGIHSFHDGIITFFHANPRNFDSTLAQTLHDAIDRGLAGAVVALVLAGLLYLLARHAVRELTAPGVVCHCPPPWRPQIKQWGMDPTDTRWASPVPPSTMATAPGYGTPAPGYGAPVFGTTDGDPSPHSASIPWAVAAPVAVATAPPGWYPIAGDAALWGWWTGATWCAVQRWNGYWWQPG